MEGATIYKVTNKENRTASLGFGDTNIEEPRPNYPKYTRTKNENIKNNAKMNWYATERQNYVKYYW